MNDLHNDRKKLSAEDVLAIDHNHIWHPYASVTPSPQVWPVESAQGVRLTLSTGETLIDGMSSWWSTIHGYNHPVLNKAAHSQIEKMSHVMFGGLTHEPATSLTQRLVELSPGGLNRVFLSDSGSVSVDVAIKMALQYWQSKGFPSKHKLLAFRHGYHGDTLGAMALCDPDTGMHHLFSNNLTQHLFSPAPPTGFDCPVDTKWLNTFNKLLEENHQDLAAIIIEPVVQGAGGMRFYSPEYIKAIKESCEAYKILFIADEIATGFGRTGKLFACNHSNITPDIMCLGKTLTGGYVTLAATLCTDQVANTICAGEGGAFMHGPTFMANPLACAIATASIDLLISTSWQVSITRLAQGLKKGLEPAKYISGVKDVRVLGGIGVIELENPINMDVIQPLFVEQGIWIRPFGRLIYTMPPYIMSDADLHTLTHSIVKVINIYLNKDFAKNV